jgi:hypothetical protein
LPAGPVAVVIRAIGFQPTFETIQVRTHAVDTVAIPLRSDVEYDIRCSPPLFRRSGESPCVTDSAEVDATLELARRLADPTERVRPGLGQFTLAQVKLVRNESTCDRASRAYGGDKNPPRRVIVVRLGKAGYVVIDPFEPLRAGEFETTMVYDRRWRPLFGFDG